MGLLVSIAFCLFPTITWYFSTRRKLFLRLFAHEENVRETMRAMKDGEQWTRVMRTMAKLQFCIGLLMLVAALIMRWIDPAPLPASDEASTGQDAYAVIEYAKVGGKEPMLDWSDVSSFFVLSSRGPAPADNPEDGGGNWQGLAVFGDNHL
jgi:hypothetical protein